MRYVCFYSGGRWEEPHYGVAYCLANHPLGPWKDEGLPTGPSELPLTSSAGARFAHFALTRLQTIEA